MTAPMNAPVEILLVEDEKFHQLMARKFLDKGNFNYRLHIAPNGEDAMAFLYQHGTYAGAPRPDFVLLDLGLPTMSGTDVLNQIKSDPALKQIPVIVLTGVDVDILPPDFPNVPGNYRFTKWMEMKDFMDLIKSIPSCQAAFSKKAA